MIRIKNMTYEMGEGRNVKTIFFEDVDGESYHLYAKEDEDGYHRLVLALEEQSE